MPAGGGAEAAPGPGFAPSASGPEAKLGLIILRKVTLLFFYALPDEQGRNPNWEAIGYPGPPQTGGFAYDDSKAGTMAWLEQQYQKPNGGTP